MAPPPALQGSATTKLKTAARKRRLAGRNSTPRILRSCPAVKRRATPRRASLAKRRQIACVAPSARRASAASSVAVPTGPAATPAKAASVRSRCAPVARSSPLAPTSASQWVRAIPSIRPRARTSPAANAKSWTRPARSPARRAPLPSSAIAARHRPSVRKASLASGVAASSFAPTHNAQSLRARPKRAPACTSRETRKASVNAPPTADRIRPFAQAFWRQASAKTPSAANTYDLVTVLAKLR